MTYAHMNGKAMTRDEVQAAKVDSMVAGIKSRLSVINDIEEGAVPTANDDQRVFAAAIMYLFETISQKSFDDVTVNFRDRTVSYLPIDDEGNTDDDIVIQL